MRKGDAHHVADQAIRRWRTELERASRELVRWGDEARRRDCELSSGSTDLRARTLEVMTLSKEAHELEKTFLYYSKSRRGPTDGSSPAGSSLVVTQDASAALKGILDGLQHEPDQVLRLTPAEDGGIGLAVGYPTDEDRVIEYDGAAVLAVQADLPQGFRGKRLDVTQTPQGPQLILAD